MNSGAIKTKKKLMWKVIGYFSLSLFYILIKGNVYKFEGYIGLLTSHILSINYGSHMDQMLIFGPTGPKTQFSQNYIYIKKKLIW